MDRIIALIAFAGFVIAVIVVGIRLGMLLAPRLDRWTEREAEPQHEDDVGDED